MEHAAALEDVLLTSAQERFAQEHDARPGMQTVDHRAVFLYRDEPRITLRWLVDDAGCAEEVASFRRSVA
jgi:hypothetical protein